MGISFKFNTQAETLEFVEQHVERLWNARIWHWFSLNDSFVCTRTTHHIVGLHGKDFLKNVIEMEDAAFEGLGKLEAEFGGASARKQSKMLDSFTAHVYEQCAERWDGLEVKYWMMFGRGF